MKLGRILVEKRHKKGITQEELAAYLGVSKAAVSKWENEMTYPDITLLPQLAAYFNITIDDLLGYEPQTNTGNRQKFKSATPNWRKALLCFLFRKYWSIAESS